MKKNNKIKLLLILLVSVALLSASGLVKKGISEADEKKYVETCFEATPGEDCAKLTGESGEEAEKQYKNSLTSLEGQGDSPAGT